MKRLLGLTADYATQFLGSLSTRPVHAAASVDELRASLDGPLPEQGTDPEQVVAELVAAAEPGVVAMAGGRYFGFVIGGSLPAALAADWLTSTWDLLRDGLQDAPRIRVLVGEERHVTIDRALRFLGIGATQIESIPADAQGRMQPDGLRAALDGVSGPTIVCAQAGNVNTGSFDPVGEIAWNPEFSRRARGFPIYAAIRSLGHEGIAALVERSCDHAARFAELLEEPGVEVLNDVVLNQVLVRFGGSDRVTEATVKAVQDEGTCWLSGTRWRGRAAMRISVSNWQTTAEDVDRSAAAILGAFAAVSAAG